MSDSASDPLLLFSPPNSTSNGASSSVRPKKKTRPRVEVFIQAPALSAAEKEKYKSVPPSFIDGIEFDETDIDAVVGEHRIGTDLYYFARFKESGEIHRFPAQQFRAEYKDLVDIYERKKDEGNLDPFDPSSSAVHINSRVRTIITINKTSSTATKTIAKQPSKRSETPLTELLSSAEPSESDEEDVDRSDDEDYAINDEPLRRSTRTATIKREKIKVALPFSPKKTRNRPRPPPLDSDDELNSFDEDGSDIEVVPTRKSDRTRKSARKNLADDYIADDSQSDSDDYVDAPSRLSVKSKNKPKKIIRGKDSRPAYGHFRMVVDLDVDLYSDDETLPLREHRDVCEKCHEKAAHIQLEAAKKKGGRKSKKSRGEEDDFVEDDNERMQNLGGWVRCLKCPVVAHWRCLAKTQRDEILKAARLRDKEKWKATHQGEEPSADDFPLRKGLDSYWSTEFICGACMKGGTCMGCKEIALQTDISLLPKQVGEGPATSSAAKAIAIPNLEHPQDVEMADGTAPPNPDSAAHDEDDTKGPRELLYRCFSCKRLAHYRHLPVPENLQPEDDSPVSDVDLAVYYQETTGWKCGDCASLVYPLDKILAWRPYPSSAVEPTYTNGEGPDPKTMLPREYLVKWIERSYRRTQWVPHMWLVSTNWTKLKNFVKSGTKVPLLPEPIPENHAMDIDAPPERGDGIIPFDPVADGTLVADAKPNESSLDAAPDAERRIPLAWKTVERVLDVRFWRTTPKQRQNSKKNRTAKARHGRKSAQVITSDIEEDMEEDIIEERPAEWHKAFDQGEQPDNDLLQSVDEFLSELKESLSPKHIEYVVWAFIKWNDLGYEEATWDSPPRKGEPGYQAFEDAFHRFIDSRKVFISKSAKDVETLENRSKDGYGRFAIRKDAQPVLGQNSQLKLMDFQIDGFNWLCDNWWNLQPCILADEMGLGKTVQIVTFLGTIIGKFKAAPALVVVPNSTITNWVREFSRWAPGLRVVPFYGEAKARQVIIDYELFHDTAPKGMSNIKYHVLVTTYETLINNRDFGPVFKKVPRWEVLVVDEGQRLKSDNSLLFKKLNELNTIQRIIMTGTPLNNNIRELFNLMNFLDPDKWTDLENLAKVYEVLTEDLVKDLHTRLRPYFLRRIKSEVLQLPPKNEVIVPVSMSPLQKEIYKSILSQNYNLLKTLTRSFNAKAGPAGANKTSMNNILMQLRKCLQHPYLISDDIEPRNLPSLEAHEKLIDASAKLRLMKILLAKLKARGHRVLIFSQFVIALNIVEDFVREEGYNYLRLDGNTKQADRQKGMDEFNRPGSDVFIYLLTTRAGGVGINLFTADTVIIFDPDFNPHQDLQAIARSHRFGQTKTCLVFKLMVKGSAEERIVQTGKKKLILDHVIVQKMDDGDSAGDDMKSILTFGAKALFEEGESSSDIIYTETDIEKLVEKTEKEGDDKEQAKESGLSFSFAKVWAAEKDSLEELQDKIPENDQGDSWTQALERIAAAKGATQALEATGRGARRRAAPAFPQQNLDSIEGLEDSPDKSKTKKKTKAIKPPTSDSDDAYSGSHGAKSENSDASTVSMNAEAEPLLEHADKEVINGEKPHKVKKKRHHKRRNLYENDSNEDICGLCGGNHVGPCYMTESSENLVEYREILLKHIFDEPMGEKQAAIDAIEKTLHARGKGHLLIGQPLKLVNSFKVSTPKPIAASSQPVPQAQPMTSRASSSRRSPADNIAPPRPVARKKPAESGTNGMMVPQNGIHRDKKGKAVDRGRYSPPANRSSSPMRLSKRASSPGPIAEPSKKYKPAAPECPVCMQSYHLIKDCGIVRQGSTSIAAAITRLEKDPNQGFAVGVLRKLLRHQAKKGSGG
ncbi:hypothetical protein BJ138DRAFT_1064605 [Hygrophoropsis aurantiaca]|uniref:Uncharacterized protein n=1 Tax=Hygrophoropsis aurantiaca TaxID=72124 RepID=A0ACB8AD96_9AGAM|nr:hypothetical protein BJ138DRAFT_1064605 [Hygrophoropsis aurantiaca]